MSELLPQFDHAAKRLYDDLKEQQFHISSEIKIVEAILVQLKQDAVDQIKEHEIKIDSLKKLI